MTTKINAIQGTDSTQSSSSVKQATQSNNNSEIKITLKDFVKKSGTPTTGEIATKSSYTNYAEELYQQAKDQGLDCSLEQIQDELKSQYGEPAQKTEGNSLNLKT